MNYIFFSEKYPCVMFRSNGGLVIRVLRLTMIKKNMRTRGSVLRLFQRALQVLLDKLGDVDQDITDIVRLWLTRADASIDSLLKSLMAIKTKRKAASTTKPARVAKRKAASTAKPARVVKRKAASTAKPARVVKRKAASTAKLAPRHFSSSSSSSSSSSRTPALHSSSSSSSSPSPPALHSSSSSSSSSTPALHSSSSSSSSSSPSVSSKGPPTKEDKEKEDIRRMVGSL